MEARSRVRRPGRLAQPLSRTIYYIISSIMLYQIIVCSCICIVLENIISQYITLYCIMFVVVASGARPARSSEANQ